MIKDGWKFVSLATLTTLRKLSNLGWICWVLNQLIIEVALLERWRACTVLISTLDCVPRSAARIFHNIRTKE